MKRNHAIHFNHKIQFNLDSSRLHFKRLIGILATESATIYLLYNLFY